MNQVPPDKLTVYRKDGEWWIRIGAGLASGTIKRTFAWACMSRRLARDVERATQTVTALFQIVMIKLIIRRIARCREF
jgi:hypothetical protein